MNILFIYSIKFNKFNNKRDLGKTWTSFDQFDATQNENKKGCVILYQILPLKTAVVSEEK